MRVLFSGVVLALALLVASPVMASDVDQSTRSGTYVFIGADNYVGDYKVDERYGNGQRTGVDGRLQDAIFENDEGKGRETASPRPTKTEVKDRRYSGDQDGEKVVKAIQSALNALGYYDGRIDGDWGPKSKRAYARWRQERGYSGAVSEEEINALLEERKKADGGSDTTNASPFNKYTKEKKLKCFGDGGKIFNIYKNRNTITINADGVPLPFEIGKGTLKNKNKDQYIINFGLYEIFIDFENRNAALSMLGIQNDLTCF